MTSDTTLQARLTTSRTHGLPQKEPQQDRVRHCTAIIARGGKKRQRQRQRERGIKEMVKRAKRETKKRIRKGHLSS